MVELVGRSGGRSSSPPPDFVLEMLDRDFGSDSAEFKRMLSKVTWSVLEKDGFRSDMRELSKETGLLAYIFNQCRLVVKDVFTTHFSLEVLTGVASSPMTALERVLSFHKHSKLFLRILKAVEEEDPEGLSVYQGKFDVTEQLLSVSIPPEIVAQLEKVLSNRHNGGTDHFNDLFNWARDKGAYTGWERIPRVLYADYKAPGLLDRFQRRCKERQKTALLKGYAQLQDKADEYIDRWHSALKEALAVAKRLVELYSFILVMAKVSGEDIYVGGVED